MLRLVYMLMAVVLSSCLTGCALFYRYDAISEKPPESAASAPLQPRESSLQPSLTAPLSLVEAAANQAVDKVLPYTPPEGHQGFDVDNKVFGVCLPCLHADLYWDFTAYKLANISISGRNNELAIRLPAGADGEARIGGDLAKYLSLHKRFGVGVVVDFGIGLDVDSSFCPHPTSSHADFAWSPQPYVEVVGRNCLFGACVGPWRLEFGSYAEPAIRGQLSAVNATLYHAIDCQPIRDKVAEVWHPYAFPVHVPYEDLYFNIVPEKIYFPGLGVTQSDLVFEGRLDILASLDPAPVSTTPLPFPSNTPLTVTPGRFSLAVPLSARYYTLSALAKQALDGQRFEASTPLGGVRVTPMGLDIYPTDDGRSLAIGVQVAVEFQYLFFLNTSGTLWLTATPEAVDSGRRMRLKDVKVTRKFSNQIWNLASVVLDDKISNAIRDGFELDMTVPIAKAEADITNMINNAGQGSPVTFQARDVRLGLGRFLANSKAFQLEVLFDALVSAQLGQIAAAH
jgi:hypothetical protein